MSSFSFLERNSQLIHEGLNEIYNHLDWQEETEEKIMLSRLFFNT